jgi:hypothetical protein
MPVLRERPWLLPICLIKVVVRKGRICREMHEGHAGYKLMNQEPGQFLLLRTPRLPHYITSAGRRATRHHAQCLGSLLLVLLPWRLSWGCIVEVSNTYGSCSRSAGRDVAHYSHNVARLCSARPKNAKHVMDSFRRE